MSEITAKLSTALADRYQIERRLGEGGMATVYLAEDLKHQRKVALKVLRPELAAVLGAERFVQEITTTANLQHPHILPLFDSGEADGFLYYVMPFVDGETLREKLNRETQLGIDEAVKIATDVADALHYAHGNNVIHRDIKPENILLHDGRPMVADFGIALAVSAAAGGRMTETGLSLGTPHYMSPEQATAEKDLSARSDIYSVGCVLYEMLTGNPPHVGSSAQQIIMRIVTEEAQPVTSARKSVPPHVAAALAKSLEKLPADRFGSAAQFSEALSNPAFAPTDARTVGASVQATAVPPFRRSAATIALATATALALLLAAWGWLRPSPTSPVTRLDLSFGDITPRTGDPVVISRDGRMLAASGFRDGEQAIFVRALDEADFRKVPGTEDGIDPAFSPDGEWLVFRSQSQQSLVKLSVSGGGALTLVPRGEINPFEPHWGEDGTIAFGGPTGLYVMPATGGPPRFLGRRGSRGPQMLPDGSGVLSYGGAAGVLLYDLSADSGHILIPSGSNPIYVETGHILYVPPEGGLFAVPFDLKRHEITGPPLPVLDRVAGSLRARGHDVSRGGTLLHHEGSGGLNAGGGTTLLVTSLTGQVDTLRLPPGRRTLPRFSPDGRVIVYELNSADDPETDLYTFDLVTGTNTQITFDSDNDDPLWSPDGSRILFNAEIEGSDSAVSEDLYVKPADNSSGRELILSLSEDQWPLAWLSPDLIVFASDEAGNDDLFTLSLSGNGDPQPYLQAPWDEFEFALAPDGTLAAIVSDETEAPEVWLRDFPTPEGKWRVSFGGGRAPRWSPDGQLLYFWRSFGGDQQDSLMVARVDRTPQVVVRQPELVYVTQMENVSWDLHPDGDRFIVATRAGGTDPTGVVADAPDRFLVVLNWFEELKARMGK
jgi:Tol biopolymer transport system component